MPSALASLYEGGHLSKVGTVCNAEGRSPLRSLTERGEIGAKREPSARAPAVAPAEIQQELLRQHYGIAESIGNSTETTS